MMDSRSTVASRLDDLVHEHDMGTPATRGVVSRVPRTLIV